MTTDATNSERLIELAEECERAIPRQSTDRWRDHDGKGRPQSSAAFVEVRFRDGEARSTTSAFLCWVWDRRQNPMDIMQWRFAPEPLGVTRAGKLLIENAETISAALRALAEKKG